MALVDLVTLRHRDYYRLEHCPDDALRAGRPAVMQSTEPLNGPNKSKGSRQRPDHLERPTRKYHDRRLTDDSPLIQ